MPCMPGCNLVKIKETIMRRRDTSDGATGGTVRPVTHTVTLISIQEVHTVSTTQHNQNPHLNTGGRRRYDTSDLGNRYDNWTPQQCRRLLKNEMIDDCMKYVERKDAQINRLDAARNMRRKLAEESKRRQQQQEESRRLDEERRKREQEERKRLDEERRKLAEESRRRQQEEERRREQEQEERRRMDGERRRQQEQEERRKMDEERRRQEQEKKEKWRRQQNSSNRSTTSPLRPTSKWETCPWYDEVKSVYDQLLQNNNRTERCVPKTTWRKAQLRIHNDKQQQNQPSENTQECKDDTSELSSSLTFKDTSEKRSENNIFFVFPQKNTQIPQMHPAI